MLPQRSFPDGLDGNFTAYISRQLTTFDLRLAAAPPEAVGFPRRVTYAGSRAGLTSAGQRLFRAEYQPRFQTFIHAGSCRKLTYTWAAGGPFHVDVLHNRESEEWNIYKLRAGRLISHTSGRGYGEAMIRASGIGLHASEPAFTFAGDPEECRRENVAQAGSAGEGEAELGGEAEVGEGCGNQTLVFGIVPSALGGSNLVFVPLEKARELAAIAGAMAARTWGEFKLKMPANRLPELQATFLECGAWLSFDSFYQAHTQSGTRAERDALWQRYEELAPGKRMPLEEDRFQPEAVPGAADGRWPERPEQTMLHWLPAAIFARWGRACSRRGDFLILDPGCAPEILAALEAAGYSCSWDEELVRLASGGSSMVAF